MDILAQETQTVGTLTERVHQTHSCWRKATPEPRRMPNFHQTPTFKPQRWVTFPAEATYFSNTQSFQTETEPRKSLVLRVQWDVSIRDKVTKGVELTNPPLFCVDVNPLNAELNPICCLLALLGAHHFLHVSRIRVKSLILRLLMSYIYMEHLFLMFLDHTQRRTRVGRTPLDE